LYDAVLGFFPGILPGILPGFFQEEFQEDPGNSRKVIFVIIFRKI
jgi:hypothetical protein